MLDKIGKFCVRVLMGILIIFSIITYTAWLKEPKMEHIYSNGMRCYYAPSGEAIMCQAQQRNQLGHQLI